MVPQVAATVSLGLNVLEPVNLSLYVGGGVFVNGTGNLVEEGLDVKVNNALNNRYDLPILLGSPMRWVIQQLVWREGIPKPLGEEI
jgi:hypothetical protein